VGRAAGAGRRGEGSGARRRVRPHGHPHHAGQQPVQPRGGAPAAGVDEPRRRGRAPARRLRRRRHQRAGALLLLLFSPRTPSFCLNIIAANALAKAGPAATSRTQQRLQSHCTGMVGQRKHAHPSCGRQRATGRAQRPGRPRASRTVCCAGWPGPARPMPEALRACSLRSVWPALRLRQALTPALTLCKALTLCCGRAPSWPWRTRSAGCSGCSTTQRSCTASAARPRCGTSCSASPASRPTGRSRPCWRRSWRSCGRRRAPRAAPALPVRRGCRRSPPPGAL